MGDFNIWRQMVIGDVVGHSPLEVTLLTGLASVIVGLISLKQNIDNPIVHLNYASGKGKSTACSLACSTVGEPFEGKKMSLDQYGNIITKESVFQSWSATDNAITARYAGNMGVVGILNELGKYKGKNCDSIIFSLSEGSDKSRLNSNCVAYTLAPYHTTFLSCGEMSLLGRCTSKLEGLHVRVMEIDEQLTTDAAHANRIKEVCSEHNGWAVPMLAEYIINNGGIDMVIDYYKKNISLLGGYLPEEFPQVDRFIEKFPAIIITTAELATMALNINFDINGLLKFFKNYMEKHSKENNKVQDDYDEIMSYLKRNINHFYDENESKTVSNPWGKVYHPNTPTGDGRTITDEFAVDRVTMDGILKRMGFSNPTTTLRQLREAGYMDCEEGTLTRKRKIFPNSDKAEKVNIFRVFSDADDSNDAHSDSNTTFVIPDNAPVIHVGDVIA